MAGKAYIFSEQVQHLLILIEESTRASQITSKYFIEPAPGTLARAASRRHHIIFGRRGSGKSSLLNKIHSANLVARTPSAFVDLEAFKGHIYPDLLLSILIQTFSEFKQWLDQPAIAPATKTNFWKKISITKPDKRKAQIEEAKALSKKICDQIEKLKGLLHQEEVVQSEDVVNRSSQTTSKTTATVRAELPGTPVSGAVSGEVADGRENSTSQRRTYETHKHKSLQRNILEYQNIFKSIKAISQSEVFLILDDLYHIPRSDQADVIDYFHKIAKGGNFWLKIGTVRHRTEHYRNGNPPVGMKLSDDIDSLDLDVTLEKYATTKNFLFDILLKFAGDCDVQVDAVLTDGARDRLVLASGGVARDFLSLFRKAVEEARERVANGDLSRGDRAGAEDVNRAAGRYYDAKLQELDRDTTADDKQDVEQQIAQVRDFCINKSNANCILVEKDRRSDLGNHIGELVDLKILHPIRSGLTVSKKPGKRFDAFMLDYSFYTGDRTKRNFDSIDFWKPNVGEEILRRVGLIYEQN